MPSATRELYREHHLIFKVLWALERFVNSLEEGETDVSDLGLFAGFFTQLADHHHAEKEETVLLPALERAGAAWDRGPLANARREHRQERYFMRIFSQRAELDRKLATAEDRRHLIGELKEFIRYMSQHMRDEEEHVFPRVRLLSESERDQLDIAAARFDQESERLDELTTQKHVAEQLCDKYPPLSSRPGAAPERRSSLPVESESKPSN